MGFDTVIRGGTLITPSGPVNADLGIAGGRIAAIGLICWASGLSTRPASSCLPGAIDPHVHLQMPAGAVMSSDDWETGTIAAACGGTTTVIDFVEPEPVGARPSLHEASGGEQMASGNASPLLGALAARRAGSRGPRRH